MAIRSPVHVASRRAAAEEPVVAHFCERVLAAFGGRIERIVLFGSRARGDEHAESDWDFAVFFDHAPTEHEQRALSDLTWAVQREFATEIQSMARSGQAWLATDELSCNIRDHGRVVYGPAEIPMIERPVLEHAQVALGKAERFARAVAGTPDDRFEGVVHGAYYAMFHAARAALLAVEGSASTNHGRVVETFRRWSRRRRAKAGRRARGGPGSRIQAQDEGGLRRRGPDRGGPRASGPSWARSSCSARKLVDAAARGG